MSLTDPVRPLAPVHRPLAVLVGPGPARDGSVRRALHDAGHRLRTASTLGGIAAGPEERVAVVVVDAATLQGDVAVPGGAVVFARHAADDHVDALWRSYRHGAVPWTVGTESVPVVATTGAVAGELALEALHEDLLGRHAAACLLLASVREPEDLHEVVDVLVAAGAASLERLRHRSRYPVPTDLLVQHLPSHVGTLQGTDFALWWNMVEAAAFRASGLRLPLPDTGRPGRPHALAFGAFHATSTILRFTARRQWRPPATLLGDLAEVG